MLHDSLSIHFLGNAFNHPCSPLGFYFLSSVILFCFSLLLLFHFFIRLVIIYLGDCGTILCCKYSMCLIVTTMPLHVLYVRICGFSPMIVFEVTLANLLVAMVGYCYVTIDSDYHKNFFLSLDCT